MNLRALGAHASLYDGYIARRPSWTDAGLVRLGIKNIPDVHVRRDAAKARGEATGGHASMAMLLVVFRRAPHLWLLL